MRPLKLQFFLSYGILGCLAPLLPVFLKDTKGLNEAQIGVAMSMVSASTLLSPSLMTLLADTKLETRYLLALAYGVTSMVLGSLLLPFGGFGATLPLMAVYGLAMVAVLPLQDGLFFSTARAREAQGEAVAAYPSVRVWGTAGFILPALILWPVVRFTEDARPAVAGAAIYCLVCLVTSLLALPRVPSAPARESTARRLPTLDAIRVLAGPQIRFLSAGLVLASAASVAYHYFFPLYLREKLGVPPQWLPAIINLGVVFEIFYTLGYATLQRKLGLKGLIVCGLCCMTVRLALLAQFPSLATALIVQLGHGFEIIALFVAPVMLINRMAGDHFRNSMQGAFSMLLGASRLLGSLFAGSVARIDLCLAFGAAAVIGLTSVLVLVFLFHTSPEEAEGHHAPVG